MAGLHFEQFSIGQRFDHEVRRTVTDKDETGDTTFPKPDL